MAAAVCSSFECEQTTVKEGAVMRSFQRAFKQSLIVAEETAISPSEKEKSHVLYEADLLAVRAELFSPHYKDTRPQDEGNAAGHDALDQDSLLSIFAYLSQGDLLALCAQVCRSWRLAASSENLWRAAFTSRWGLPPQGTAAEEEWASCMPSAGGFRALYIRAATSRVMSWGHGSACIKAQAPRVPCDVPGTTTVCVRSVAAGTCFSSLITWDGTVMCWGVNEYGQCGVAPSITTFVEHPTRLMMGAAHSTRVLGAGQGTAAVSVSCGVAHAAAVNVRGEMFCWGCNEVGQLGIAHSETADDAPYTHVPHMPYLEHILGDACVSFKSVACGGAHTLALTSGGVMLAWGRNDSSQCGVPPQQGIIISEPHVMESTLDLGVNAIYAGGAFSLFQTSAGMWSFGANGVGQLGRDTCGQDDAHAGLVHIEAGHDAVARAACGEEHCVCAMHDGSVWVWGKGTQAALGLGGQMRNQGTPKEVQALSGMRVTSVTCAASSAVLCESNAKVLLTWGPNRSGELGHGDVSKRTVPRQVKGARAGGIYAVALGAQHCVAVCEWRMSTQGSVGSKRTSSGVGAVRQTHKNTQNEVVRGKACSVGGKGGDSKGGAKSPPERVAGGKGAVSGGKGRRRRTSLEHVDDEDVKAAAAEWASMVSEQSGGTVLEDLGWDLGSGQCAPRSRRGGRGRRQGSSNVHVHHASAPVPCADEVLDDGFVAFLIEVDDPILWETSWSARAGSFLSELQQFAMDVRRRKITFPVTLSARHRREIHLLSTSMRLSHQSHGSGPDRRIEVTKDDDYASASSSSSVSRASSSGSIVNV